MKLKIMSQKNGNLVRFAILNKKPIKHKNLCVFICSSQKNRQKNHLVPLPAIKNYFTRLLQCHRPYALSYRLSAQAFRRA